MCQITCDYIVLLFAILCISYCNGAAFDIQLDAEEQSLKTSNLLSNTLLVILTVVTIWQFKRRRGGFLHESGMSIIHGTIVGAVIRYSGSSSQILICKFIAVMLVITLHYLLVHCRYI